MDNKISHYLKRTLNSQITMRLTNRLATAIFIDLSGINFDKNYTAEIWFIRTRMRMFLTYSPPVKRKIKVQKDYNRLQNLFSYDLELPLII